MNLAFIVGWNNSTFSIEHDCRVVFHARQETIELITVYIRNRHPNVRAEYVEMKHWKELPQLATEVQDDHLFVIITARKGYYIL